MDVGRKEIGKCIFLIFKGTLMKAGRVEKKREFNLSSISDPTIVTKVLVSTISDPTIVTRVL